jgi:hypothetical protein
MNNSNNELNSVQMYEIAPAHLVANSIALMMHDKEKRLDHSASILSAVGYDLKNLDNAYAFFDDFELTPDNIMNFKDIAHIAYDALANKNQNVKPFEHDAVAFACKMLMGGLYLYTEKALNDSYVFLFRKLYKQMDLGVDTSFDLSEKAILHMKSCYDYIADDKPLTLSFIATERSKKKSILIATAILASKITTNAIRQDAINYLLDPSSYSLDSSTVSPGYFFSVSEAIKVADNLYSKANVNHPVMIALEAMNPEYELVPQIKIAVAIKELEAISIREKGETYDLGAVFVTIMEAMKALGVIETSLPDTFWGENSENCTIDCAIEAIDSVCVAFQDESFPLMRLIIKI